MSYFFRSAKIKYIEKRYSDTLIVFMHGILSNSEKAFRLYNDDGYFWDLLSNKYNLSNIDFLEFNYGLIDLSFILEGKSPINGLNRLSKELYSQIKEYNNVIFIGHSQGGLLAKTYSTLYSEIQGIFLITLHTPHKDMSMLVMRSEIGEKWSNYFSYRIPHLFAASVNDNKIVKASNALHGCKDISYCSKDNSFEFLGHHHLSQCPDRGLINIIERNLIYFRSSGLSKSPFIYKAYKNLLSDQTRQVVFLLSSSHVKLMKHMEKTKDVKFITDPWHHEFFDRPFSNISELKSLYQKNDMIFRFAVAGLSLNCFLRHIYNLPDHRDIKVTVLKLDNTPHGYCSEANDFICEKIFHHETFHQSNPYNDLLFDVYDFNRKQLIDNIDFIDVLCRILEQNGFTLKKAYESVDENENSKEEYNDMLLKYYRDAIIQYREIFLNNLFEDGFKYSKVNMFVFRTGAIETIKDFIKLKEKSFEYISLFEMIKRKFEKIHYNISIKGIEFCISRIFKNNNGLYVIDKNVKMLFSAGYYHSSQMLRNT